MKTVENGRRLDNAFFHHRDIRRATNRIAEGKRGISGFLLWKFLLSIDYASDCITAARYKYHRFPIFSATLEHHFETIQFTIQDYGCKMNQCLSVSLTRLQNL